MSSHITVKKNLIIFHDWLEWEHIKELLVKDFGVKILMRHVMKRDLGFTVRNHKGLVSAGSKKNPNKMYYEDQVHLDFYTESALSWFQLRYLNRNTQVLLS